MSALLLERPVRGARGPAHHPRRRGRWPRAAVRVDPIGLDELMALAELQTRVDRKYFVPAEVFDRLNRRAGRQDLPAGLRATLVTTYRRTTFVSRSGEARLTCDVGLVCRDLHHEVRDTGTHVLVESKSAGREGAPRIGCCATSGCARPR